MKKIILIILIIVLTKSNVTSQVIDDSMTHIDSVNELKVNSIYANKSNYIRQPLSLLFNSIYRPFEFGYPDNISTWKSKVYDVYFKDFVLWLPSGQGDVNYGFTIHLVNKFYLPNQIYQAKRKEGYLQLNDYLESVIKNEIVADIEKW